MAKKDMSHLKEHQFKKGQSGNPEGGRMHNKELRELRNLSVESFNKIIHLVMTGTMADLKRLGEDPTATVAEVSVATSILIATKKGDYSTVKEIVEQVIGKIPIPVNVHHTGMPVPEAPVDMDKLRAAVAELRKNV